MTSQKKMSRNLLGLIVSVALFVGAPALGTGATILSLRGAFREAGNVDPSEKARFLANGISESMNGTAIGIAVSLVALAAIVIFAVRYSRESKRAAQQT